MVYKVWSRNLLYVVECSYDRVRWVKMPPETLKRTSGGSRVTALAIPSSKLAKHVKNQSTTLEVLHRCVNFATNPTYAPIMMKISSTTTFYHILENCKQFVVNFNVTA